MHRLRVNDTFDIEPFDEAMRGFLRPWQLECRFQTPRIKIDCASRSFTLASSVDNSELSLHAVDRVAQLQRESASIEVDLMKVRTPPEYFSAVSALDYGAVERARSMTDRRLNP